MAVARRPAQVNALMIPPAVPRALVVHQPQVNALVPVKKAKQVQAPQVNVPKKRQRFLSEILLEAFTTWIGELGEVDNDPLQSDFEKLGRLTDLANEMGLEGAERIAFFKKNGFG